MVRLLPDGNNDPDDLQTENARALTARYYCCKIILL